MIVSRALIAAGAMIGILSVNFAAARETPAAEPPATEYGPSPVIGAPEKSLLPTLHVAKAIGWPSGAKPVAASGTTVNALARGLDHPRWLYVCPTAMFWSPSPTRRRNPTTRRESAARCTNW